MTIEEQLKNLVIERGGSVNKFAGKCGLPYSTIASVFNRGIVNSNISTIIAICRELHISADELCNGRITPLQYLDSNAEYLNLSGLTEENQAKIAENTKVIQKVIHKKNPATSSHGVFPFPKEDLYGEILSK